MTLVKFANGNKGGILKPSYTDVLDSLFNPEPFFPKNNSQRTPAVNIAETDTELLIELAVPGLKKEDFKINLEQDRLHISSDQQNKADSDKKKYNRREFNFDTFSRTFILPESADQSAILADYTDGVLSIRISKKEEAKSQSREIFVK